MIAEPTANNNHAPISGVTGGNTCSKLKLDNLFLQWFSLPDSQNMVRKPAMQLNLSFFTPLCFYAVWYPFAAGAPTIRGCKAGPTRGRFLAKKEALRT